jgi:ABC transporter substrate binding protein (PQQ-dependent alcohol dehydrogenase system)
MSGTGMVRVRVLMLLCTVTPLLVVSGRAQAQDTTVEILFLQQRTPAPTVLSTLVAPPEDEALRGVELGVDDNNTTGRFLGQEYLINSVIANPDESLVDLAQEALADGSRLVVVDAPADTLVELVDLDEAADDLLINARARDKHLRESDCRAQMLHTVASRQMLADALMQFLSMRRWSRLFLVEGLRAEDAAWADALQASADKFGLDIVERVAWTADADLRRNAGQEVPALTQARRYDLVLVADEARDFAEFVLYNTWLPRPVAGSAGLVATDWSAVVEQWGAAQLQSRFGDLAGRHMTAYDYAAWAAVRAIGEAVTRTKATDADTIREYLLSDAFELAAFKGSSLSFRAWNGQLRQRIPLVHANAVVANTPLEGFLHPVSELDTLGSDRAESTCTAFGE